MKKILKVLSVSFLLAGCHRAPPPEAPRAEQHFFRYQRAVTIPPASESAHACAVLDAEVFAHAQPSLGDLRLYDAGAELPYVATISEASGAGSEPARILNRGVRQGRAVFDLAMPRRPYTEFDLALNARDFVGDVTVSGSSEPGGTPTALGTFVVFDLRAQGLALDETVRLQESTFPFLHLEVAMRPLPGKPKGFDLANLLDGVTVPPSRAAQTLYRPVAESTVITQEGRDSVAEFLVPAHVPVDHVLLMPLASERRNFARRVRVRIGAAGTADSALGEAAYEEVLRVRLNQGAETIGDENLGLPVALPAFGDHGTRIEVRVENGDDPPLGWKSVVLEMRERKLCFDPVAGTPVVLDYGDPVLPPPSYDYPRTFDPSARAAAAVLGTEEPNPAFAEREVPRRALTERHPELLWVGLIAVVLVLGLVAFRSAKSLPQ